MPSKSTVAKAPSARAVERLVLAAKAYAKDIRKHIKDGSFSPTIGKSPESDFLKAVDGLRKKKR